MNQAEFLLCLDQLSALYLVLVILIIAVIVAGFLFWIGLVAWCLRFVGVVLNYGIRNGFQLWQRLLSWASWPLFLAMVLTSLFAGWAFQGLPFITLVFALIPLFMGVTACLAYMFIDLERYAVSRGYKAVHNPLAGQQLAENLVRYGQAVGVPLLIAATVGMIGGFALLNFGLFLTIGHDWYAVKAGEAAPTYVDFLANTLIVLLHIVDVLDFARASHVLDAAYVRQVKWPATALLAVFRLFFTLVLLQQVFASFRKGQVLSETISDLWNPNEPIHARACHALPQFGPGAVGPLLRSLSHVESLTKEQRERLTLMLADIGPAAMPSLVRHLHDAQEHVRAIAVASLGQLKIRQTVVLLVPLCQDSSDIVRQSLIHALGVIAGPESILGDAKSLLPLLRRGRLRSANPREFTTPMSAADSVKLAVKTLQSALTDNSLSVRASAARALGQIGHSANVATPGLLTLLDDEDETVRQAAIEAVAKVGGPSSAVIDGLIKRLDDPSAALQAAAAKELGAMGADAAAACDALVPLLQDREEEVRDAAAEAMGKIGHIDEEAADEMVEGLASLDCVVRAQTAEALGTIGESAQETAPALVDALADESDMVRAKAVEALGKIGEAVGDLAVPGLVRALGDQDTLVSSLAAEALGQMGESAEQAIPSLVGSLSHINADVRASAAESLGKFGAEAMGAHVALERACLDDDADVRRQAILALSTIGELSESTMHVFCSGLEDPDAEVRLAAVEAFSRWSHPDDSTGGVMLQMLEDPNEQVRIQVTKVLPHLIGATDPVVEGLCCRLRDDTDLVQAQAAESLGELGAEAGKAGATLLHAARTGEATVRKQAMLAIALIRPSEYLVTLDSSEVESDLIESLREIETPSQPESPESVLDVIPIVVSPVIDAVTGKQVDISVEVVLPGEIGQVIQSMADNIDREETVQQE